MPKLHNHKIISNLQQEIYRLRKRNKGLMGVWETVVESREYWYNKAKSFTLYSGGIGLGMPIMYIKKE